MQLCLLLDHRVDDGSSREEQPHKLVFHFPWILPYILPSLLSTFTVLWNIKCKTWWHKVLWTISGQVWQTQNTWKVERIGDSRIVLALASFSSRDETGGNAPSTTDNDETELFMKESIDLSAPHWCCKPNAPQRGAGVYCFLCFTNRLFPSPEWSQYPWS